MNRVKFETFSFHNPKLSVFFLEYNFVLPTFRKKDEYHICHNCDDKIGELVSLYVLGHVDYSYTIISNSGFLFYLHIRMKFCFSFFSKITWWIFNSLDYVLGGISEVLHVYFPLSTSWIVSGVIRDFRKLVNRKIETFFYYTLRFLLSWAILVEFFFSSFFFLPLFFFFFNYITELFKWNVMEIITFIKFIYSQNLCHNILK